MLKKASAYMIRNDGTFFPCYLMHPYINYNIDNSDQASILRLIKNEPYDMLQWFYEHTLSSKTKELIESFVESLRVCGYDYNSPLYSDCYVDNNKELFTLFHALNDACNQEFLRMRTSSMKFGGFDNSIYFRVSSKNFNWFNIIWELVYEHKSWISDVTICTDLQSKNETSVRFYQIGNVKINKLPVDEFINLPGNPIIESKYPITNNLLSGQNLLESIGDYHPYHIHAMYSSMNDVFDKNFI